MNRSFIITFAPFNSLKHMSAIILGIESSCDDTSAAVIKDGYLLSNVDQVKPYMKHTVE